MTHDVVNTKEKLTTTYMVNGRHVPAELKKINYLLRDWRRNAVTNIDTKTIDLVWELHADLGSRAPIHIISGYRSAETNALLKNIGRNVAKRSMHIQGKAIDLFFPDVPTERLRNSALVRDVGGVGFYPRSGASGFVHVDSGRVRHWPSISKDQIARIRREYVKTVGARLGRGQAVQVASADVPGVTEVVGVAEEGYPTPMPRPRPIEVLMMAAAHTIVQPVSAPAPINNFAAPVAPPAPVALIATSEPASASMAPKVDLAFADLTIAPVAAPVPTPSNFAEKTSLVGDTLGSELEPELIGDVIVEQVVEKPEAPPIAKDNFFLALRDGLAAGAEDLLAWPAQLISGAESLIWQGSTPARLASASPSAPLAEANDPFPPITEEDEAELERVLAALRSKADYEARSKSQASRAAAKSDRLSDIRARKGDLILTTPIPRYGAGGSASLESPVRQVAAQTQETLRDAVDRVE
jgi:uncharacterized protein YcbK (DUF882 family)